MPVKCGVTAAAETNRTTTDTFQQKADKEGAAHCTNMQSLLCCQ